MHVIHPSCVKDFDGNYKAMKNKTRIDPAKYFQMYRKELPQNKTRHRCPFCGHGPFAALGKEPQGGNTGSGHLANTCSSLARSREKQLLLTKYKNHTRQASVFTMLTAKGSGARAPQVAAALPTAVLGPAPAPPVPSAIVITTREYIEKEQIEIEKRTRPAAQSNETFET